MLSKSYKKRLIDIYYAVYNVAAPVDSFLRGSFLTEGSKSRSAFSITVSPVRLLVNALSHVFAGIFTFFALIPVGIYHAVKTSKHTVCLDKATNEAEKAGVLARRAPSAVTHKNNEAAISAAYGAFEAVKFGDTKEAEAKTADVSKLRQNSTATVLQSVGGKSSKVANCQVIAEQNEKSTQPVKAAVKQVFSNIKAAVTITTLKPKKKQVKKTNTKAASAFGIGL